VEIDIRKESKEATIRFDKDDNLCGCVINPTTDYGCVVIQSRQNEDGDSQHFIYINKDSIDNLIKGLEKSKELWGDE